MTKTVLESMLLDDRAERVRMVAAMAYGGAFITKGVRETLAEAEQSLEKDPSKAKERLAFAQRQCALLEKTWMDNLESFIRYVENRGKES